ncbi:syntaxin, putative [Plasmodium berghei]|uniref:Protein transport protein BOS1, putative n=2 Tax=Plasmodium berghei TaxID=5821 RepID=A0A509AMI1_PLABA|nr:protein transport protein BOS1, putative [Plasmodium berghei ANKA]CXI45505.1 syntaxin, putative [Plasmodium berghei]SCM22684.1 syntaxin, putative [Plasmodium berghei]SCN25596.1 syntaxin, putative [Plasmodium berghei]SCO60540.1 syntaxin, putative [Plasmodium berghei]SCO62298.1 syntaxin, putative [Plasmodium berghei]|eukprot:XP_034421714.1 protein transport protein BOS1, putative [Plasmodium berghei ANKA]
MEKMGYKYEAFLGDDIGNTDLINNKIENNRESDDNEMKESSLNNIYSKIIKIRKELEKNYNLFYSYNLIISSNDKQENMNSSYNNYTNMYNKNSNILSNNNTASNNITLNKINALTNSFYVNVETLKNTFEFINTNNREILNSKNMIWEKRIETLNSEANSYIKTLDNIYKTNLRKQEQIRNNNNSNESLGYLHNKKKKKFENDDNTISYLHKERDILKDVENNLNIFHVQGINTLDMLRKQNKFLKGVRKKVIDMYNYIGLSSSLISTIKKTDKQNLIIVIVGIILSSIFFYVLYSYFKR